MFLFDLVLVSCSSEFMDSIGSLPLGQGFRFGSFFRVKRTYASDAYDEEGGRKSLERKKNPPLFITPFVPFYRSFDVFSILTGSSYSTYLREFKKIQFIVKVNYMLN